MADLTAREIEVLQALADGLSTEEAAKKLYISPNTVKTHLRRIGEKLGLGRTPRELLVAIGFRKGLLT